MNNTEDFKLIENTDGQLAAVVQHFLKSIPSVLNKEKELEKLREDFVNSFTVNKITSLSKEEYVVGTGNKSTFCYRIETELKDLGDIHGSTSLKFGLYYGKLGDDRTQKYRIAKKFGDNPDKAMDIIKRDIVDLIIAGNNNNLDGINSNELSPIFKSKILSVYYPKKYLNIFSVEHLDHFAIYLDLEVSKNDSILTKQQKLLEWKLSHTFSKDWSNYVFSRFLYESYGKPLEKLEQTEQDIRDSKYPKEYVSDLKIARKTWEIMLENNEIFKSEDVELLKRIYLSDNHATTCYDLSIQDGTTPQAYISPVVALCKRISNYLDLKPVINNCNECVWWRILFWGRYREDNKFEWKLRPELAKAMESKFPDLQKQNNWIFEEKEDDKLVQELKEVSLISKSFEYSGTPKKKALPIFVDSHKTYPRDKNVALNALACACYKCEINNNHPTFIRKKSDLTYTEPHHLIPMSYSDEFDVSLDVEENIVSLCSNCHNEIHYGRDAYKLIEELYDKRKEFLHKVGIDVTLERLKEMYK